MTGMTSCREIRQALGVYVLGAIDPAERAQVDEHLAACADCREELAGLAGLPAMLRKIPVIEAERLAAPDAEHDIPGVPSEQVLQSLVARTTNVRRIHRWRGLAAAAAVVLLALGGGAVVGHALQPSASPKPPGHQLVDWHTVTGAGTGPMAGVHLTVRYRHVPAGTVIEARATGVAPGSQCMFQVTDKGGTAWPLGGWWQQSWRPSTWSPSSTWLTDQDLSSFQLSVNNHKVSVRAT